MILPVRRQEAQDCGEKKCRYCGEMMYTSTFQGVPMKNPKGWWIDTL